MTHDLVATFTNSLGKTHNWTYKDIDTGLSPQEIKDACDLLTTLDIFQENGVKRFDAVVTAKIVTTIERGIFDRKAAASHENEAEERAEEVVDTSDAPLTTETEVSTGADSSALTETISPMPPAAVSVQAPLVGQAQTALFSTEPVGIPVRAPASSRQTKRTPPQKRRRRFPLLFFKKKQQE